MIGFAKPFDKQRCVDLRQQFGRRYRVESEEGHSGWSEDPWLLIIPCRYGHICVWSRERLAACVDGHRKVANRLRGLGCCTVVQDGDLGELTATFDVHDFAEVAAVMLPKRRPGPRELSAAERVNLVDAGKDHRFLGRSTGVRASFSTRRRDSRGLQVF